MKEQVRKMLWEIAKHDYNEIANMVAKMTFVEAYNKLKGYNLTSDPTFVNETELMGFNTFFDFKYKSIEGTIFLAKENSCELHEIINVDCGDGVVAHGLTING